MKVEHWLEAAKADAERRSLPALLPLLEGVARTMTALRAADFETMLSGADRSPKPRVSVAAGQAQAAATPDPSLPQIEHALARIAELNPTLNAFVTVTADEARAAAAARDRERAEGRARGPLHGRPIALKDIVDMTGVPTTASSNVRKGHVAARDAVVTGRLRAAGAVFVGKTNLHEFALGTTSEDSAFGAARNPIDPTRSPGGSSGGSAIAVATGMAWAAVGTDTGGSIRIPSAACGLVGLKPQWGEISADGVVPLSRQLDHVGPIARSVSDAWLMYDVMRAEVPGGAGGPVETGRADGNAAPQPRQAHQGHLRIGVPRGYLFDRLDEEVERHVIASIERLRTVGATVVDVTIPHLADTPNIYLLLAISDAAEFHARTLESRPFDYTEAVRLRLEMGRYMLSEDYVRALRGKRALTLGVEAALASVDVLALPALSIPAPPIGASTVAVKGGIEAVRAAMLRCTQPFNVTGHPAISLPCGRTAAGLPVGLQLVGPLFGTEALLSAALAVERALA
jgi:aspartyl-tRNA(Asn)/glutamyl-tRNA(Gln) amidotransferase subunit A